MVVNWGGLLFECNWCCLGNGGYFDKLVSIVVGFLFFCNVIGWW